MARAALSRLGRLASNKSLSLPPDVPNPYGHQSFKPRFSALKPFFINEMSQSFCLRFNIKRFSALSTEGTSKQANTKYAHYYTLRSGISVDDLVQTLYQVSTKSPTRIPVGGSICFVSWTSAKIEHHMKHIILKRLAGKVK
jgi:hypothetical protein